LGIDRKNPRFRYPMSVELASGKRDFPGGEPISPIAHHNQPREPARPQAFQKQQGAERIQRIERRAKAAGGFGGEGVDMPRAPNRFSVRKEGETGESRPPV